MAINPIRKTDDKEGLVSPAIVRKTSLDTAAHRSFLSDIAIDFGDRDALGRMFLQADTRLREKGYFVSFGTFDELMDLNKANSDNWRPLLPIFDPAGWEPSNRNSFVVFARDSSGKIAYAAASRLYELGGKSLKDEIESLRILYPDPKSQAWEGEYIDVSAPIAAKVNGRVVFTGAQWVHPEHRGANFTVSTVPITRGIAYTRWYPDLTFSFMAPEIVKAGVAWKCYMNVDWEVTMVNTPVLRNGTINAGLMWTNPQLMEAHFADVLEGTSTRRDAQIDRGIYDGPADKKLAG
ncbi:MAG: hypothetical protein R3D67_14175 [Hyphomicrobiaceae bacterium]